MNNMQYNKKKSGVLYGIRIYRVQRYAAMVV